MVVLFPSLARLFNILTSICKWGFLFVSVLIMYLNGFVGTPRDWLLILTILFALLVTICEIFGILHIRLLTREDNQCQTKSQKSK